LMSVKSNLLRGGESEILKLK